MESNITASRPITQEEADADLLRADSKSTNPAIVRYSLGDEGIVFWIGALVALASFVGAIWLLAGIEVRPR